MKVPQILSRVESQPNAALAPVDALVVFGEPNPLEMILVVRPDVIVKGGDYGIVTAVGAQAVQSWGRQVKMVPTVERFSTTRLIARSAGK
jgi:D-beta-D-heptose 7-phosphate kinase/D-beta-D-heptose 1-phosphate adenosyltransferase